MTTEQRRSELVRARRSQRKSKTTGSRSSNGSSQRPMPPMVSRNGMVTPPSASQPRRRSQQSTSRGRVDLPLGSGAAEITLRGVPLLSISWRAASFGLLAVFVFLFFWLWSSPQYTVSSDRVTVNGLMRVDKSMLLDRAGIINLPVFRIDPAKLAATITEKIPAVAEAQVSVGINGAVVIEVVERIPVLTWEQESLSQVSWVDLDGRIFPALGSSENLVVIKANAAPPIPAKPLVAEEQSLTEDEDDDSPLPTPEPALEDQLLRPEMVSGIMTLSQALPEGGTLVYDGSRGFGWEDPQHGWTVYFGKQLDQSELRLTVYQQIVAMFEEKERKPVMISVEYVHAPYFRMEP
jgi:hypothetical protein